MSFLKALRDTLNMSQQELATAIGASITSVSRWENGKSATLTVAQFKALNKLLSQIGMTIDQIPDTLGPINTSK